MPGKWMQQEGESIWQRPKKQRPRSVFLRFSRVVETAFRHASKGACMMTELWHLVVVVVDSVLTLHFENFGSWLAKSWLHGGVQRIAKFGEAKKVINKKWNDGCAAVSSQFRNTTSASSDLWRGVDRFVFFYIFFTDKNKKTIKFYMQVRFRITQSWTFKHLSEHKFNFFFLTANWSSAIPF